MQITNTILICRISTLLIVVSFLLGLLQPLKASAQCAISGKTFTDGEEISYIISYNWGPVWIDAGIVTFKTKFELRKDKPVWNVISTGRTYRSYDLLYKVRDTYESWIDTTTFQTIEFRRYVYEGGYQLQNTSWFDYSRRIVFSNTKINDNPLVVDTIRMIDCTFDMLSAVYYVRSLDLSSVTEKDTIPVYVAIDDSVYRIDIRFQGKEIVEHPDGIYYRCNRFSATMVEGTIFTKDQEAFVWVTDDPNKIPIYIEAKILIGSVKAYLKKVTGLKYPMAIVK